MAMMLRSLARPLERCLGLRAGGDGLMWHTDLKPHASGDYSIAVVQANKNLEDQSQVFTSPLGTYVGVYDGHGGPEASRFVNKHLFPFLHKFATEQGGLSADVIKKAFNATEEEFLHLVKQSLPVRPQIASVGSCCLVGAISNDVLYVANLGDSRAVLGKRVSEDKKNKVVAERLSTDHNVGVEEVRKEVEALHPDDSHVVVYTRGVWRIKGIIQVSRSIGDVYLKKPDFYRDPIFQRFGNPVPLKRPVITAEPSILIRKLKPQDLFLIFASDGLWEQLSDENAVDIVFRNPRAGIAKRLVSAALREVAKKREMRYSDIKKIEKGIRRHFHDDITVIVIYLDQHRGSSHNIVKHNAMGCTMAPIDIYSYNADEGYEGDDHCSDDMSSACLEVLRKSGSNGSVPLAASGESNDDLPLISLIRPSKKSPKDKTTDTANNNISKEPDETSPKSLSKSTSNQQTVVGRKRVRLVLSDDEGDVPHEVECSARRLHKRPVDFAASDEFTRKISPASSDDKLQDTSPVASRSPSRPCNLINIEESTCSYKSVGNRTVSNGKNTRSLSNAEVVIGSDYADSASKCDINASENLLHRYNSPLKLQATDNEVDGCMEFKIDDNKINVAVSSFMAADKISIEPLKVELACLYYLQLPVEKRSKGLLPIIQNMECGGRPLESIENLDSLRNHLMNVSVDVLINGWIQKRLMKLYIDSCKELCETPNMKLLKKLYVSKVEDEVNVSECELQDISVIPLLNALHTHKGVALLDLSHNLLGNGTMEKLQRFFSSSGQKYGDLTLDLHCNRFGPTALFQICECPVLFTRLEVLNISGNRLTDACGSYLSTILEKCRALYSLNIERCSITSRTIQKVADALDTESVLSQLFIGHNNPISGNAISSLLGKLAILKRFSEFSLNGLKLSKTVVDGICHLAKTSCLSRLMLEGTAIGTDGALRLTRSLFSSTQEPLKLDLSFCGVASTYIYELNTNAIFISGILELHLGGNPIMQEGGNALSSLLLNPQCCLKVLNLKKCQLGMAGILQIVHALAENESLEELNLANNADTDKQLGILYCKPTNSSESSQPNHIVSEPSLNPCSSKEFDELDPNYNKLEVADSEDDEVRVETAASGFNDSSASSCQRRNSTLECQFIQELSIAIGLAKQLQVLDLSNNGLSVQASEALYNAWSSGSRAGLSWRHIKDQIVHLSVEGNKCCRLKSCCKKD